MLATSRQLHTDNLDSRPESHSTFDYELFGC
jgi:hypothetical protein